MAAIESDDGPKIIPPQNLNAERFQSLFDVENHPLSPAYSPRFGGGESFTLQQDGEGTVHITVYTDSFDFADRPVKKNKSPIITVVEEKKSPDQKPEEHIIYRVEKVSKDSEGIEVNGITGKEEVNINIGYKGEVSVFKKPSERTVKLPKPQRPSGDMFTKLGLFNKPH